LSILFLAGCEPPGRPDPADRPVPTNKVLDFKTLYAQNCSGCHGADGTLGPAPPLNDPLFLSIIPDAELLRVVREGRRGTPMPAFANDHGGPLTKAQVEVVATGIKARWGKPKAPENDKVPPYLTRSAGSAKRGETVFKRACADCHGEHGQGIKSEGQVAHRIHEPAFLALISDQALRRYVITGRPDLGMPNYAEPRPDDADFTPLTATDVDDLVALLSSWAPSRPAGGRTLEESK
jgi:mono/diheme cytochrome c family protein